MLMLAEGGAGSTGGRMQGGTTSSLLVTSGTLNKTVMLLVLMSRQELVDSQEMTGNKMSRKLKQHGLNEE